MRLPPPAMTPEDGIAVMAARVTELRELKRRMLVQYAEAPECQVLSLDQEITAVNRQLREACVRRDEYLTQLKGQN